MEETLDVRFEACAGIRAYQKNVVACRIYTAPDGVLRKETQTYRTLPQGLPGLGDWLAEANITHVALEGTGDYWQSVYDILGGKFEVWIVDLHIFKNVPARPANANDARWLAELMRYGLLQPIFNSRQKQRKR